MEELEEIKEEEFPETIKIPESNLTDEEAEQLEQFLSTLLREHNLTMEELMEQVEDSNNECIFSEL